MNKCKNCGTEFEGKFCPECGEPWQEETEKICPHCGTAVKSGAKFCSECGYSFAEKRPRPAPAEGKPFAPAERKPFAPAEGKPSVPAEGKPSVPAERKPFAPAWTGSALFYVYQAVKFLPEILFALFSVLAYVFLAAPVVHVTSAGQFLGVADVGTGYQVLSVEGVDGLRDPAGALLVFAALGTMFALVCAVSAWKWGWKRRRRTPLSYGFFAFYFVFLVIAGVMIANTADLDEGLNVLGAGACPVCFLVFSILFAAGHAASILVFRRLKDGLGIKAAEKAREEAIEAKKARLAEFYATHEKPRMKTPKTKKNAVIYKYEQKYYDKGKEKTPSAVLVFCDMYKAVLAVAAAVLVVAVVLMATLIPRSVDRLRIGAAEDIALGSSKEQVADVLGEPYGEDRTSDDWFYYDDGLLAYTKRAQSLAEQQEEALMQGDFSRAEQLAREAAALAAQVEAEAFKCIEITFADGKAESVFFDTRYSFEPQAKEREHYRQSGVGYYQDLTVSPPRYRLMEGMDDAGFYEVYFTDGSYYKAHVKSGGTLTADSYTWSDAYGTYSAAAAMIGKVDENGEWSAEVDTLNRFERASFALPYGVDKIGSYSFSHCTALTGIILPDTVTSVGECAFYCCDALTNVTLPRGVTSIEYGAFMSCNGLTDIRFKGTVKEWKAIKKDINWDRYTGDYTVTCTDGTVDKQGNVTEL